MPRGVAAREIRLCVCVCVCVSVCLFAELTEGNHNVNTQFKHAGLYLSGFFTNCSIKSKLANVLTQQL